jgi:hypothetical protein
LREYSRYLPDASLRIMALALEVSLRNNPSYGEKFRSPSIGLTGQAIALRKARHSVRVGSLAQLRMASGRLRQHFLWRSSLQLSGLCRPFIGIDDSLNKRCARRLQRSFDRGHDFLRPLTAISVGAARFGKGHEIDWR